VTIAHPLETSGTVWLSRVEPLTRTE